VKANIFIPLLVLIIPFGLAAQVTLEADGPGDTYELINSAFAPNGNVVENPECAHPEFGRHIAEVWDSDLNQYVFEFYIHVTPDNDRCINFDRQRMEIKTYASSPDNLIGTAGERIEYRWKFRLPAGFQPSTSFTHIHQIKAVGGDDGNPIFTLTPRKASPNRLELIHNNTTKVRTVPLALFEGTWVECHEVITVGTTGTYFLEISKVSDGTVLLNYENNQIMTMRPDNDFIRPKWGIYRSLNAAADLRDEAVRFAGFSIEELNTGLVASASAVPASTELYQNYPNPFNPTTTIGYTLSTGGYVRLEVFDLTGRLVAGLVNQEQSGGNYRIIFNGSSLPSGVYFYRLVSDQYTGTRKFILVK
jgi:hypothetical protein